MTMSSIYLVWLERHEVARQIAYYNRALAGMCRYTYIVEFVPVENSTGVK